MFDVLFCLRISTYSSNTEEGHSEMMTYLSQFEASVGQDGLWRIEISLMPLWIGKCYYTTVYPILTTAFTQKLI